MASRFGHFGTGRFQTAHFRPMTPEPADAQTLRYTGLASASVVEHHAVCQSRRTQPQQARTGTGVY